MEYFYKPILMLMPLYIVLIGVEMFYSWHNQRQLYRPRDTLANIAVGIGHNLTGTATGLLLAVVFMKIYQFRLFDIPNTWWTFLLLLLGQDFSYYWLHRKSHECRWLWASHVVHHSSENLNFSTSFRLGWTSLISLNWLFWIPLIWLGFSPTLVFLMITVNLSFQFFLHTQLVKKLGGLELIFNTPSHHRVHHAVNPEYLDRNYGGVLIIWDRLFGTFAEEKDSDPCRYGIIKPLRSHNPFIIAFNEWAAIFKDVMQAPTLMGKLGYMFGPPGWSHDGSRQTSDQIRQTYRATIPIVEQQVG